MPVTSLELLHCVASVRAKDGRWPTAPVLASRLRIRLRECTARVHELTSAGLLKWFRDWGKSGEIRLSPDPYDDPPPRPRVHRKTPRVEVSIVVPRVDGEAQFRLETVAGAAVGREYAHPEEATKAARVLGREMRRRLVVVRISDGARLTYYHEERRRLRSAGVEV